MEVLPSKELLEAVTGEKIIRIDENKSHDSILAYFNDKQLHHKYINTYELMHLMKEWAGNKKEVISSYKKHGNYYAGLWWNERRDLSGNDLLFRGNTEFEAVTKACELILEQQ